MKTRNSPSNPFTVAPLPDKYIEIVEVKSSTLTYTGRAMTPDVTETKPEWQIWRTTVIGNTTKAEVAGDGAFAYRWADRMTLFPAPTFENTRSLVFDGINDSVDFGNVFNYDHTNQWSMSFWIKPDNTAAQRALYSKTSNDANVYGWGLYIDASGRLMLQMRAPGALRQHTGTAVIPSGQWTQVTMTYNGSSNINGVRFYLNGVLDTVTATGAFSSSLLTGAPARLGQRNGGFFFVGKMDEAYIFSRALTGAEVVELYHLGSPNNPINFSFYSAIVDYYKLGDGDLSVTAFDTIGTNPGTLSGSPAFSSDVP